MSQVFLMPGAEAVHSLFAMMYGDDVSIADGPDFDPTANGKTQVAIFIDDTDAPVAACVCDMPFAAFAAASFSRIPVGAAEDAIGGDPMSDMMQSNLHELMNICSKLFMDDRSSHLRLSVVQPVGEVADNVTALLGGAEKKNSFAAEFPGYGKGKITFVVG